MLGRIRSGAVPSHRGCDVMMKFSHLVIKIMKEWQYTLLATSETGNLKERRNTFMIRVVGGNVKRPNEDDIYAVPVEDVVFEAGIRLADGQIDAQGGKIILTTSRPPHEPYVVQEQIKYFDGNNNNTRFFIVNSVKGPAKYSVQ